MKTWMWLLIIVGIVVALGGTIITQRVFIADQQVLNTKMDSLQSVNNSLQAECDSLYRIIDSNPRYMKGLVWYWSADDPYMIYHNDCKSETLWVKQRD